MSVNGYNLFTVYFQEASPSSFYAVYDGHAGHDAAAYSAAHLHQYLAESKHFVSDPEQALKEAFCKTDKLFLDKCAVEVRLKIRFGAIETKSRFLQNLNSGTTAVCALLRPKDKTLYVAWVGDSLALLVNQGRIMQCVNPHKPERVVRFRFVGAKGFLLETPGFLSWQTIGVECKHDRNLESVTSHVSYNWYCSTIVHMFRLYQAIYKRLHSLVSSRFQQLKSLLIFPHLAWEFLCLKVR